MECCAGACDERARQCLDATKKVTSDFELVLVDDGSLAGLSRAARELIVLLDLKARLTGAALRARANNRKDHRHAVCVCSGLE